MVEDLRGSSFQTGTVLVVFLYSCIPAVLYSVHHTFLHMHSFSLSGIAIASGFLGGISNF